jgi:hypothetical protein|nr:MAG TPA: hypothetical protein [Caudoviricetes sp.]
MGRYLVTYILTMIFLFIADLIFKLGNTFHAILIATIMWGVLSICDAIENTARYKNHDEFHRALMKRIELHEKLRGK